MLCTRVDHLAPGLAHIHSVASHPLRVCIYTLTAATQVQPECHFYVHDCEIQNVVANVIIPGSSPAIPPDSRLNIHAMMLQLNANVKEHACQYRKNLFPGLVYRPANSPVVVLCFCSGKCVVTGGKTIEDVHLGWRLLWKDIKRFVVDPQGRAFLSNHQVLQPRLQ